MYNKAKGSSNEPQDSEEIEEAAWLQSVGAAGLDSITHVKGLESGALVMDIGHLRPQAEAGFSRRH